MLSLLLQLGPGAEGGRIDWPGGITERATRPGSRGLRRVRQGLVVAQLGASLTLLIGAGLLANGCLKLRDVDPGFRPDDVRAASPPCGETLRVLAPLTAEVRR
jgi:hypothetical protein